MLIIFFILGLLASILLQRQLMYRRDFKFLDLKWQDVTQLFNRHAGQWLTLAIILIALVVGGSLGGRHIFTRSTTQRCSVGKCFVCNTSCFDRNRFSNSDLPHILEKVIKNSPKGYCVKNPIDFVIKLIKTVPRTVF